jgi:heterodisulfide reductase subunit B2
MKLSYYPGCSLEGTAADYDQSVRAVCASLGVELVEIGDWNCCGASSAHMTAHHAGMRLAIRNLLLAEDAGHDILVPCAACFQRLKAAAEVLREDPLYWDGQGYTGKRRIIHISTLLADPNLVAKMAEAVPHKLTGLRVACYYGCLSLRPPRLSEAENHEMPNTLERIVTAVGAEPVRWSHRTECCSGSLTMTRADIAEKLVGDIVTAAARAGAQALVTDCPMCQANVESRQPADGRERLPVFYATELIAAALSGDYPARQRRCHLVDPGVLPRSLAVSGEEVR